MNLQSLVGQNVRKRRLEMGMSQEELAHKAGLHRTYVGGIERGERNPSLSSLAKIADALDVDPQYLLSSNE